MMTERLTGERGDRQIGKERGGDRKVGRDKVGEKEWRGNEGEERWKG